MKHSLKIRYFYWLDQGYTLHKVQIVSSESSGFKIWSNSTRIISISAAEIARSDAIAARKEEAKKCRRKKKRTVSSSSLASNTFHVRLFFQYLYLKLLLPLKEIYRLTGEVLGQGAYACVRTCMNVYTEVEYAVKIIEKVPAHSRSRVFKEIDLFYHSKVGFANKIQV